MNHFFKGSFPILFSLVEFPFQFGPQICILLLEDVFVARVLRTHVELTPIYQTIPSHPKIP